MTIDLYYLVESGPCRSVMMCARALGVELNLIRLDLFNGEHLKPDFLKINPQHCIPTINDDGFILCESRAILCYLFNKYGKDDSMYPKDPEKRAIVDHRLYFDIGNIYQKLIDYYVPAIYMNDTLRPEKLQTLEEAFKIFDKFLEGNEWAAGSHITLADFALAATVATADVLVDVNINQFPNVARWYAKCKTDIDGYDELNLAGCLQYRKMFDKIKAEK